MSTDETLFENFLTDPYKTTHPVYKNSFLAFSNAPGYAAPEVLLASLYRTIGLKKSDAGVDKKISESDVGKNGTNLAKVIDKHRKSGKKRGELSVEGWGRVIDEVIRSPKQPSQRNKGAIQLTPIIPTCAAFSMAASLRGHPWNPGSFIESCISLGEVTKDKAEATWEQLFKCLSVSDDDDVWAQFLQRELKEWSPDEIKWSFNSLKESPEWMQEWQKAGVKHPAARFVKDLKHVMLAKNSLTRRQWTTVLESCLRNGLGSHTLWVTKCNRDLYRIVDDVLNGGDVPSIHDIVERLSTENGFWTYEQAVGGQIKKLVREYIYGRIGLNLLLYRAMEVEPLKELVKNLPFRSPASIHTFLTALSKARDEFDYSSYQLAFENTLETDPRKTSAKAGVGKNLEEFLRHSLGQRETHEKGLESYDQGYLFSRKR